MKQSGNEGMWMSEHNQYRDKSKKVKNYGKILKNTYIQNANNISRMNYEDYKRKSHETNQRRGNIDNPSLILMGASEYDNETGIVAERHQMKGPLGSKYMNRYIDNDIASNSLNSISSTNNFGYNG